MNNQSKRQEKYDKSNTRRFGLKLNLTTDRDVIKKLEEVNSIQGYIKELIRKDIMKYVVVDIHRNYTDIWTTVCATLEEAENEARRGWEKMTDYDKSQTEAYYILATTEPEEEEGSLDGDIIKRYK